MLAPKRPQDEKFDEAQPLALFAKDLVSQANTRQVQMSGGGTLDVPVVAGAPFGGGGGGYSPFSEVMSSAPANQYDTQVFTGEDPVNFPRAVIPDNSERPVADAKGNRLRMILGLASLGVAGAGALAGGDFGDFLVSAGSGAAMGFADQQQAAAAQLREQQGQFDARKKELEDFNMLQAVAEAKYRAEIQSDRRRAARELANSQVQLDSVRNRLMEVETLRALADLDRERERARGDIQLERERTLGDIQLQNAKAGTPTTGEQAQMMNARTREAELQLQKLKDEAALAKGSQIDRPNLQDFVDVESEIDMLMKASAIADPGQTATLQKQLRELRAQRSGMMRNMTPAQLRELQRYQTLVRDAEQLGVEAPSFDPADPNRLQYPALSKMRQRYSLENQISQKDLENMKKMYEAGQLTKEEYDAVLQVVGAGSNP